MPGQKQYDVVILGGGSAGYSCALRASQLGQSVALIEREQLGGTCLHRGCIPTKALLHAAERADAVRTATGLGIGAAFTGVDLPATHRYKRGIVDRLFGGLQGLVKAAEIDLVLGEGFLAGPTSVRVGNDVYQGHNLVLATGSRPRSLPGVQLGDAVVTSDQALEIAKVPQRAVIVGGSVIGVEFASMWRSFGAEVTVVEALPRLVPSEDPTLSKLLERAFRGRGIVVRTGTTLMGVEPTDSGVRVALSDGNSLSADLVLVAVGREPNVDGFEDSDQRIALDGGWVAVDEALHTNVENVYAVGDLVRGPQLAHRGFAHGIFVAERICGLEPDPVLDLNIPKVTYCEPQLASVGLTEPQAVAAFGAADTVEYNLAGNGKSQILEASGTVKLVRQPGGPIVGVHMIGTGMGEQVGEAALWVNWEAHPSDVARFIHAHPTQNESLGEAAMALAGKALHGHA